MSGVCKIARGYFKLLRGQTASEKPASTSEVLSCMHKLLIQETEQCNGKDPGQKVNRTRFYLWSHAMSLQLHSSVQSSLPPPPCPNKVICPQSTAFLKSFLNIQARCVMCLLVVKRGETTNQCTHTFVFATIFIRHSVRHSEKRKRKIIVVASAEWREVGVRTEQIGT